MKIFFIILSLLIATLSYSQNNLLNLEKESIISFMKDKKKEYVQSKDSITISGFKYLEYFYSPKEMPNNGICAYIFYFESFINTKKCTSIRAIILKEKIDSSINLLNRSSIKLDTNKWYEEKGNALFTLYTVKNLKNNDTFYVLDITNFK